MSRHINLPVQIDLGGVDLTVTQKINYFLNRLEKYDAARAKLYR